MKLSHRFRKLTFWNKLGVIGAIASIMGLFVTFLFFYIDGVGSRNNSRPRPPSLQSSSEGRTEPRGPIDGHEANRDTLGYISSSEPPESKSRLEIHVLTHDRTSLRFSLVSQGLARWAVNRLYLKYMAEYEPESNVEGPPTTRSEVASNDSMPPMSVVDDSLAIALGAVTNDSVLSVLYRLEPRIDVGEFFFAGVGATMWFSERYGIALSREYSEYDLIPLVPDQDALGFEYRGPDSDDFSVELYGTDVSVVRICAEIYDFETKEHSTIQSKNIPVVRSPGLRPNRNASLSIASRRLMDDLRPLSYKVLTSVDFGEFLRKLQPFQLQAIRSDLNKFRSLVSSRVEPNKSKPKDIGNSTGLTASYEADTSSPPEGELRRQTGFMPMPIARSGGAIDSVLTGRVEKILEEIDNIAKE
jgi:hypothetical protein